MPENNISDGMIKTEDNFTQDKENSEESKEFDIAYYEEENRLLKSTINHLRKELSRLREPPLMIAEITEVLGDKAIISISTGNKFVVNVSSRLMGHVSPGDFVTVEQKNLNIVDKIDEKIKEFNVQRYVIIEKPSVSWKDIGGLDEQISEIKEIIELPLKNPNLFRKVGITPPKGILLYGPPGTGKTMLAKAVAHETDSTFIELVGSELVQKFIGEGAKLVREIFNLAKEKAPSIIFIDELDSIASKRVEIGTSGEREVQRTFMQLLAEIDGFKGLDNVKIIGCTNRKDILDPAIIRPGRLDRLIYVPLPNIKARKEIFSIHTSNMHLDKNITLTELAKMTEGFSGADIKAMCTEAGFFAIRKKRYVIKKEDFEKAAKKVKLESEVNTNFKFMFG